MASSLGVFVRYGILKNVGYFNTQLGKGARIPIGEDTEYVMRLRDCSTKYQYSPELIQIHAYHKKLKNEKLTSFRFLVYKSFSKPSLSIHAMRSALALVVKHEARLIDVFNVISEEVRYFLEK
jgi:GT2 family glycosyltransferase